MVPASLLPYAFFFFFIKTNANFFSLKRWNGLIAQQRNFGSVQRRTRHNLYIYFVSIFKKMWVSFMPEYQLNFIAAAKNVLGSFQRRWCSENVHIQSLQTAHWGLFLLLLFKLYHVTFNVLLVITCYYSVLLPDYLLGLKRIENRTV